MRPKKYPEFHCWHGDERACFCNGIGLRDMFESGGARVHAQYMYEMSIRHPVMYFLFYRWWLFMFLHEDQKNNIAECIKYIRDNHSRPYWAEFALYHPVLYCLFWFIISIFEFVVKLFTSPIKIIKRSEKIEE